MYEDTVRNYGKITVVGELGENWESKTNQDTTPLLPRYASPQSFFETFLILAYSLRVI
jgi:hypothetical protein